MSEDMSFEILGTTPMSSYNGSPSIGAEVELGRLRLSSSASSGTRSPLRSPLSHSTSNVDKENRGQDIALDILLRKKTPSADFLQNLKLPSLNAEFPSLSGANLAEEDLSKLQMIIAEHRQLKENLLRANSVIRQYFGSVEKWQSEVKQSKEEDRQRISALLANNQKLQQELRQLQQQHQQQLQSNDQSGQKTNSSEEVDALRRELAQAKEAMKEMIPRLTHKNVERQCSQLLAENLQFKDMEQQYVDTINCLKVNHASAEELVRMGQMDLATERASNQKNLTELNNVREENQVLIQQAEIYQKDFIAERDARQRMAGEKDEVITELNRLRMLLQTPQPQMAPHPQMQGMPNGHMGYPQQQQHPQQQQQQQQHPQQGTTVAGHCGLVRFTCPGCYGQFTSQQALGQHLPQCGRFNH